MTSPEQTLLDQTKPDQTKPDQTKPDQTKPDHRETAEERAQTRRERLAWTGTAVESIGLILGCLAVVLIDANLTVTYTLLAIGGPLLVIGIFLLWWTAH